MSKLWLVALHEFKHRVKKRSFVIGILSLPALIALTLLPLWIISLLQSATDTTVGYVDLAGLLDDSIPTSAGSVSLIPFQAEKTARAALDAEEIQAYYVLSASYVRTNEVRLVHDNGIDPGAVAQFQDFLRANLLSDQPTEIAQRAIDGNTLSVRSPDGRREFSGMLTLGQLLPSLASFALVLLIFFNAGTLLDAVFEEKTNRTMEILMTSISPHQLMGGKVASAVAMSFTQLVAWAAFAILAVWIGGQYFDVAWLQNLSVDPQFLAVTIVLVIAAYVVLAGLMTTIGATLTDAQNDQQIMVIFINLYLAIPVLFVVPIIQNPDSSLAIGLSLFPFTAPTIIPFRALFTHVPGWQIAAATAILVSCAAGTLWLAGRAFRLGMLRYGQRLNWRELFGRVKSTTDDTERHRLDEGQSVTLVHTESVVPLPIKSSPPANKTFLVMRYEIGNILKNRLAIFMSFGLPLVAALIFLGALALKDNSSDVDAGASDAPDAHEVEIEGYVDQGGMIEFLPQGIPSGRLTAYADETSARQALEAGEISAYYVIPADYVEAGELISIRPTFNLLALGGQSNLMNWALLVNLLGGDVELASRVWNPLDLRVTALAPRPQARPNADENCLLPNRDCESNTFVTLVPTLTAMLLYMSIIVASGELLKSVSKEKENRVMELLMSSVHPRQLLTGKIIGLGIIGLLQAIAWLGAGYAILRLGGQTFNLPPGFEFPVAALAWSVVFFLLGYAVYASLMTGAGAMMANAKEAPQVTIMIIWPLIFPVSSLPRILDKALFHGMFETGLSLFPLTSPLAMLQRLTEGDAPLWQVLLSVALLVVAVLVIVRLAARVFRAQALLSGQPFAARRFFGALLRRT